MRHNPVLLHEVLECLDLKPGAVVVDGTLGSGGHAEAMLQRIGAKGRFIGLDQDASAITRCREIFKADSRVTLIHENFRNIGDVLKEIHVAKVDAVLLDVGMSSEQLADEQRGFSFQVKGELDMRMNPEVGFKASELIAQASESELADIFFYFGEERRARRFARVIVETRKHQPIRTTEDLTHVVEQALPMTMRFKEGNRPVWARRHPATRIFQALRIAVNDEFNALKEGILGAWEHLASAGRLAVISFHSLEDRIVKLQFREWVSLGQGKLIFRKPIVAKHSEMINNPRSRSAKLRAIEKKS
ncbi:MAG TPA: 16S rRNA (cytosine(1402)-N(4))-methyltransferase RsmH [Candidatus Omnitrophota bacterium]|nr:16S rRNA (cytosine(1402)-N(4))-methyltransferase RsmH [Candidatus Omnitrophota bacterium]